MSTLRGFFLLSVFLAAGTDVCDVFCVFAGPEEDDVQVIDKSYCQYAKSLPLPVCQPPAGMDSVPLQYAFLYRFHGTGIDLHVSPVSFLEFQIVTNQ